VKVAVLACTESKLDTERDTETQFQVKCYNTVRYDRTVNSGGGTFILIHESFCFEVIDYSSLIKPELTEATTIKIWKKGLKPIIITTIYNVPKTSIIRFNSFLQQLLRYLSQFDNERIIFGDMNIDLIKHYNQFDVNVHKYLLLLSEFGFKQVIRNSTFRDLSLLDHLAINDEDKYKSHGQFPFAGSDHQLIYAIRKCDQRRHHPRIVTGRNWKKVNWSQVECGISKLNLGPVNHPISVDTEFIRFNNNVMNIIDQHAPLKKKLVKGKFTPWMTREIVDSMKIRNKSHKKALLPRNVADWKIYRRERNETNRKINQGKRVYFKEKFQKSTESTSLWNTVDELTHFRVKVRNPICVLNDTNNSLISDENLICDILANEFIVHKENEITEENLIEQINNYEVTFDYSNSDPCDKNPPNIYSSDVMDSIKSMKNKYGRNIQFPSILVIKSCLTSFSATLCFFFSVFLKYNIIPQCFKAANVIPLYKGKGNRRQANSYRPIALLNIYSKIFERFLFSRLNLRIESQLISEQPGFRKGNGNIYSDSDFQILKSILILSVNQIPHQ
jgi:hypothetical protein